MKNQITATLIAIFMAATAMAQDFEAPKKGAKIFVDNNAIEINQNDELSFDVYLVKSRVARKATFENPKFNSPEGLDFYVKEDAADPSHYTVMLKASEIAAGDYSVMVSGKRSGIHSVTGTIVSVKVNPANSVASKDGE